MVRKVVLLVLVSVLLFLVFAVFDVGVVGAGGTIYIRTDGRVDPPTAPISTVDNIIYTFTGNINDEIVVERSNIIIDGAGHTVSGSGTGEGFSLTNINNVTIKNLTIKGFYSGIYLNGSSSNSISENNIKGNGYYGIRLFLSFNNSISENNITGNDSGVALDGSSNNTLSENNIGNYFGVVLRCSSNNTICENIIGAYWGFEIVSSSDNKIYANNITNNFVGVYFYESSDNKFYHNNFNYNYYHVQLYPAECANIWDDGYPSGGNYWGLAGYGGYSGYDYYSGPYQNETGSDGIGDTPHVIDGYNRDNYPLMTPLPWTPHDIEIKQVTPSKTVIGQGYSLHINVSIVNSGTNTETFNVTAYANVTIIDTSTDITLTRGNSTTLTFMWDTTNFVRGAYILTVNATHVLNETDTADNILIDGWVIVTIPGDVNGDHKVNVKDIFAVAKAFGSYPGHPRWDPNMDINQDLIINVKDLFAVAKNFGKENP
jgi:parallel beta-helix repeat protein